MVRSTSSLPALSWGKFTLFTALATLAWQTSATSAGGQALYVQYGQSIQAAINSAACGDTIYVGPGTYAEQLTVTTNGISLIGDGAVLVPPTSFSMNTCSGLAGNDTEAGICITGADVALAPYVSEHRKVLSVGTPVMDITIQGFEVQGFAGFNIAVVGAENTQIVQNTLVNGSVYGFLTVGSSHTLADANSVSTDSFGFIAMCMDNLADAVFVNNQISGYYIGLCIQTDGAVLARNNITNGCVGAYVDPGVDGAKVVANYVGAPNPNCGPDPPQGGIIVDGGRDSVIVLNTIVGQIGNVTAGIVVFDDPGTGSGPIIASGNTVTKNILRGNSLDLYINTTATNNIIQGNSCSNPGPGCM